MPDLNQQHPRLAKYLIQNSLWWIEFSGIDGIREDTYPYADQHFLADWAQAIRTEYPRFNIVGEIWATKPAYLAQFQEKSILPRDFETNLPAIMDFPLMDAFRQFVQGDGKLRDIHATYAQDFLYTNTDNLLVFLDNHDVSRAIFHAGGDTRRVKLALTIMMTARGIPQILYGTEINLRGGSSHVELRADFPGGFPTHARNAFRAEERTQEEQEMYAFVQTLLRIRREHAPLSSGRMVHYAPTWNNDVYKYLKFDENETLLVITNGEAESRVVALSELRHYLPEQVTLKDLMSGSSIRPRRDAIEVPALTAMVLQVLNPSQPTGRPK